MFRLYFASVFCVLVLAVQARALDETSASTGISGYKIVPLTWEVEVSPGGPTVFLNGTVQEVRARLLELNPNYDADFESVANKSEVPAVVTRESDNAPNAWICDIFDKPEGKAFVPPLMEGLQYLRSIGGQPTLGPGPGTCSRVSCSYDSAIYWCNDNLFTKVLPGFYNIADAAEQLIEECKFWNIVDYKWRISGQIFVNPPRDWNVFIQWELC